jgi:hypothetical protein
MRSAGRSASPTVPQAAEPTQPGARRGARISGRLLPRRLSGHRAADGLCVDRCLTVRAKTTGLPTSGARTLLAIYQDIRSPT